jgi:hypothetical protein
MKRVLIAGATIIIVGCGQGSARVQMPPFAVHVLVDPSAAARLRALGEAAAVGVVFEGTAHQFPHVLGAVPRVELPSTGVAGIPPVEFDATANERFASVTMTSPRHARHGPRRHANAGDV